MTHQCKFLYEYCIWWFYLCMDPCVWTLSKSELSLSRPPPLPHTTHAQPLGFPLGIVPKKLPSEIHLILHLSYPHRWLVNDAIPEQFCSVKYTSVDQAVHILHHCASGEELVKYGIKAAFCLLPVHSDGFELLGFSIDGQYYMDRALSTGCSVSCSAFKCFSPFLEWALNQKTGFQDVIHVLDDFCCPWGIWPIYQTVKRFHGVGREVRCSFGSW